MASIIKKILGLAPKHDGKEGYTPSPLALLVATKNKTDYSPVNYSSHYSGKSKVLMLCTEEQYMSMDNHRKFSTGNHPVEMLVPMLHITQAGFDIDVFTPTGKPVKIEMWAMPEKDQEVMTVYEKYQSQFNQPSSLKDLVPDSLTDDSPYIAVFIPGGHGAMLGLPENQDVGRLINWVVEQNKYMCAICHGPAALLAAGENIDKDSYIYKGYKIAAFPDSLDKITPLLGYLPGGMPWYFGERLKDLGVTIINKKASGECYKDRKLITGDSPDAANQFGKMVAEALLREVE